MNWRLVFSGVQSIGWTIGVVIAIAVAITTFALLRKYESKLVSTGVSRMLFALRLLVLILLLTVLLQPILTKSWDVDSQSRLIVGFDVSDSMETADRHASESEMLRWAQALGMLGNSATDSLLQQWTAAYDAGQEPNWAGDDNDPQLGEIRRQQVQGVFAEIAKMPRTEFVRRLLQASPNDLLTKLEAIQPVDLRVFGAEQQSVSAEQLGDLLQSDRMDLVPSATDAVSFLSAAIAESDGSDVRGVVLLTDGRQTENADFAAEASRLESLGIPVYCVPIGSTLSPRDLSIAAVQVPQSIFLDDTAQLLATVTATGYSGEEVTVKLRKGDEVIDERSVIVASDYFDVDFDIPSSEVGSFDYSVFTEVRPGEIRDDNNNRDFKVSVVDNKSHVMLVEGDARWEFRYLNSALERDKRVDLSVVLFSQPYLKLLNKPFIDNQLPNQVSMAEQLSQTDMLIIGDVEASAIPKAAWQAIERAVSDDGMSLLVIPGRRDMPHRHSSEELRRLLPVSGFTQQLAERYRRSNPNSSPSVFQLEPTAAASELTLFRLSSRGESRQMEISGLPGHPWAYSGTPKPAASVWANLVPPGMEASESDLPGVVHQYYGFGQVVWMGIDSTWRWRFRAGDRWHHRFWGQIVRWAARNKSAAGNDQVRLTLSDVVVDEGESVTASIRWSPKIVSTLEGAAVSLSIERVADPTNQTEAFATAAAAQTVALTPLKESPERYSGDLSRLRPGTYRVKLVVEGGSVTLDQEVSSDLLVQKRTSTELANISCNRDFLQQLSDASGGVVLEPWQLTELPDLVTPDSRKNVEELEVSVWDSWPIMLLFFVLLTAEWILRKMNGLP